MNAGTPWRAEIDSALPALGAALLLVSQNFLVSDSIHNNELPPLLEAADQQGLKSSGSPSAPAPSKSPPQASLLTKSSTPTSESPSTSSPLPNAKRN